MIRCGGVAPRDYPSYFTALAASHFASRGKEPFKGEIFRFIFPLKILLFSDRAHPRKLQITRLALKRKIRSCRYSSPPTEITCAGFPLGSCFGHPYWMSPRGTERPPSGHLPCKRKIFAAYQGCRALHKTWELPSVWDISIYFY